MSRTFAKANYYLESVELDKRVYQLFSGNWFDRDVIREEMEKHFFEYPEDTLIWCKVDKNLETVGDDIIDFYEMHNGFICKVVTKGSKDYYKKL